MLQEKLVSLESHGYIATEPLGEVEPNHLAAMLARLAGRPCLWVNGMDAHIAQVYLDFHTTPLKFCGMTVKLLVVNMQHVFQ